MSRPRHDRALRRAVTDLARLHPEDLAMILDALEPGEKARIDALIDEFAGKQATPAGTMLQPHAELIWTYQGVSPWLRARIDPNARTGRRSREFILMTDAGHAALIAAAEPFRTSREQAGPGRSLVGLIRDRLGGLLA